MTTHRAESQSRRLARLGATTFLVLALLLMSVPAADRAQAHFTWYYYDCVWKIGVDHWVSAAQHKAGPIPDNGSQGPWDCDLWRASVTTTSWLYGGRSGWTSQPNSTSYSNWQAAWYLAQAANGVYCRLVRAGAKAKDGSTEYAWKYNYLYYQSSCWQD